MKRIFLSFFILLFLFVKPSFAAELNPQTNLEKQTLGSINESVVGERVVNFDSNIKIQQDGSIDVVEKINYFFDSQRHGIFRNIPFTKYDKDKRYDLDFSFKPVIDENDNRYQVQKSRQNEQIVLKIGDPNRTIAGEHTYIISYTVKGTLGYFPDHDELYWNITGNGWDVPIQKATATITLPQKLNDNQIQLKCFTGAYKSTKSNCTGSTDGQTTVFQTTLFLNSNEGLSVVVGFPKKIVAVLLPKEFVPFFDTFWGGITLLGIGLIALLWYILLPIIIIINWYRNGRDPNVGIPLTAGFEPPVGMDNRKLTPTETGSLIDETVETRDIFAAIVNLAQRGHITIEETAKKDFTLHLINKPKKDDKLEPFEQKLLDGIFDGEKDAKLKDTKLYLTISEIKKTLYQKMVSDGFFKRNPNTTRTLYYVLGAFSIFTFNFVLAFVAFLFGKNMPKKTLVGAQQASVAKGLKNFLTSQERQLEFQADKQMMFEKLLPFAVAFGVEKIWAKRFEKFDLKNPDWYQSSGNTSFNSVVFASSLHNSYNNFAVSSTPPSSSGSGFGGGGFSGGGGGGGGGGSW